jgi:chromatin segregation and condensation protein Rec8/ScpA/Scc1 (kleisin family)
LLIKSKALLPQVELSEEEARDVQDLENRLKLYKELRGTQHEIKKIWDPTPTMLFREFLKHAAPVFYPPSKLKTADLHSTVAALAEQIKRVVPVAQTVKREVLI